MNPGRVFGGTPREIIRYCSERGYDISKLLDIVGVNSIDLILPDFKLPLITITTLWNEATRLTGSGTLGGEVAACVPFGTFRAIDFLTVSSPTPLVGLQKAGEYYPLLNTGFHLNLESTNNLFSATLESPNDPDLLTPQYVDFVFSSILMRARLVSPFLKASKVLLKSRGDSGIPRYLSERVIAKEKVDLLVFEVAALNIPNPGYDAELFELLTEYCDKRLRRESDPEETFMNDLLLTVRTGLIKGKFSLADSAHQVAMAPRTLQRRLLVHGTTYREIVDRVRLSLLSEEIKHGRISYRFITDVLGFAEARSFYRAFKRWYGSNFSDFLRDEKIKAS